MLVHKVNFEVVDSSRFSGSLGSEGHGRISPTVSFPEKIKTIGQLEGTTAAGFSSSQNNQMRKFNKKYNDSEIKKDCLKVIEKVSTSVEERSNEYGELTLFAGECEANHSWFTPASKIKASGFEPRFLSIQKNNKLVLFNRT